MSFIPRKAWPGLAQFAPERFGLLKLRFDSLDPESPEKKTARAELDALISEFKIWAKAFLALERQAQLLALCGQVQVERRAREEFWAKRVEQLANADLTTTEYERLMRLLNKRTERPVKPVIDALKAVEKPWKYRDETDTKYRDQ